MTVIKRITSSSASQWVTTIWVYTFQYTESISENYDMHKLFQREKAAAT